MERSTAPASAERSPTDHVPPPLSPDADPADVWSAVLEQVQGRASMNWVTNLKLVSLAGRQVRLELPRAHRELMRFITDRQRQQLADVFEQVTGQRVRIEVSLAEGGQAEAAPRPAAAPQRRQDLTEAMNLPLVKQIMDVFDATVVDARREQPLTPPTGEDGEAGDEPADEVEESHED